MHWKKLGHIFSANGQRPWMHGGYAAVPFVEWIDDEHLRIYFSARDVQNRSLTGWLTVSMEDPFKILDISPDPVIELGRAGYFDEDGIMGCCLVPANGKRYLYYIGWNRGVSVAFRNAIGLAIAEEGSNEFRKVSAGPILDRNIHDASFVASNCVRRDGELWRMWYLSCDLWQQRAGRLMHKYNIKYADSNDGIVWRPTGHKAIDYAYPDEYAISVPRVIADDDRYRMWYSYRAGPVHQTYRVGYAESDDQMNWRRMDEKMTGFDVSADGWDSEMVCYPEIFDYRGDRFLLYNGNGYGQTGFGLAILK